MQVGHKKYYFDTRHERMKTLYFFPGCKLFDASIRSSCAHYPAIRIELCLKPIQEECCCVLLFKHWTSWASVIPFTACCVWTTQVRSPLCIFIYEVPRDVEM